MTYISGAQSVALIAWENKTEWDGAASAHTASDETYMPVGHGVDVIVNRQNTGQRLHGVGARNASASIKKNYDGRITINGALSNAYWMLGILGANVDAGSPGAYTHTYTETDILPSFSLNTSMELGTTDFNSTLVGCKIETITLTTAINEPVRFILDCSYRYENTSTTALANLADVEPVFTFAHGVLELPNGSTIAAVQSVELVINQTAESLFEVGSRFKKANISKAREYNFTINAAFNDQATMLNYFFDGTNSATAPDAGSGTEIATMQLTFTNDDGDILELNFTDVQLNEESLTQNILETVKENVTGWARNCTSVVYTNDVETAPVEAS